MLRFAFLQVTVCLAWGVAFCGGGQESAAAEKSPPRPNFVFCMADDQGWGDAGYQGHPVLKTPVLDEMARSGLRFNRFYAAAPVCSPTRGSVLTGRHPNRFACFSWGHTLRPQEVTVAEALRRAGYATGHFGKWHLGSVQAASPVCPGNSGFDHWASSPNFYENNPLFSLGGRVIATRGESSQVTVELALEFIERCVRQEKPFLAVIWFGNPHTPHVATEELKALYPDQPAGKQNYYGEVTGIDRAMGLLRRGLRKLGVAENTLVWYTSDNGGRPPGSNGPLRGHKGQLWEGGIRVPAVIEWPAVIRSPRQVDIPCGTVDIYPTLLELAGVEVEHQPVLDGESLAGLIRGQQWQRRRGLGFWVYPAGGRPKHSRRILQQLQKAQQQGREPHDPKQLDLDAGKLTRSYTSQDAQRGHAAWTEGPWKLHRLPVKGGFRWELYHLGRDPSERHNVAQEHPQVVQRLRRRLAAWQSSVLDSLNGKDYQ